MIVRNYSATTTIVVLAVFMVAYFVWGCGGEETTCARTATPDYSYVKSEPKRGGMKVEGIMGTISTNRIQEIFELRLLRFERCFTEREAEIAFIGGHIEFYFRVALDGHVAWVKPKASTIGDRKTERCLTDIVKKTRFPEPRGGGEAEVAWGFEREPNPNVAQPVEVDSKSVRHVVNKNSGSIFACNIGSSNIMITAYVAPGGTVVAAGASVSDRFEADETMLDCVTNAVVGWAMPDPGATSAKVRFRVPY
jgi:hypothetical protein